MSHQSLIETAKEAINNVFSDTSVEAETTKESLLELQEEIQSLMDSLG